MAHPPRQHHSKRRGGGRIRLTEAAVPLLKRKTSPLWRFRSMLLLITAAWFAQRYFQHHLLPYGPAVPRQERIEFSLVDYGNDSLQAKHGRLQKIYDRVPPGATTLIKGPETVLFDADGVLHIMTEDAKLVSLTDFTTTTTTTTTTTASDHQAGGPSTIVATATAREVAYLGVGRPLGGCFHPLDGGSLYIADAHLGLMRLPPPGRNDSNNNNNNNQNIGRKVELMASRVRDSEAGTWTPLLFVDDAAVGPKTGRVYFTDGRWNGCLPDICVHENNVSSKYACWHASCGMLPPSGVCIDTATDILADRVGTTWDVMFASKLDSIRGKRAGRLLMFDPLTDQVTTLARDLSFPNGVRVNPDETLLFFSETFALRLHIFDLTTGQLRTMGGKLPGYPDGVDCAWTTGLCYAAIPSAVVPVHRILNVLPDSLDRILRTFLMMLPRFLAPPAEHFGGVAEVDITSGKIRRIMQDPTGKDIGRITGVTVHGNKLYLGSLENDFIGVYDLSGDVPPGEKWSLLSNREGEKWINGTPARVKLIF